VKQAPAGVIPAGGAALLADVPAQCSVRWVAGEWRCRRCGGRSKTLPYGACPAAATQGTFHMGGAL